MGLFLRKNHLLRFGGSYIIYIVKNASEKTGALIHSMKFLPPKVAFYLYKCTIQPHMEYCYHVWAGAPICYLELLDELQKWMYRTVGPLTFTCYLS